MPSERQLGCGFAQRGEHKIANGLAQRVQALLHGELCSCASSGMLICYDFFHQNLRADACNALG